MATATATLIRNASAMAWRRLDTPSPIVEKDVLRVGVWHTSYCLPTGQWTTRPWTVTPAVLQSLVENFARFTAAGNRTPWILGHATEQPIRIGDVVGLFVRGDTLYARCRPDHPDWKRRFATTGATSPDEVSVGVVERYVDGAGNVYPILMDHLAVVINPVVFPQQPFRRVLRTLVKGKATKMAGARRLEDAAADAATTTTTDPTTTTTPAVPLTSNDEATEVGVSEVVAMLNQFFGLNIPVDVDTVKELRLVLESMGVAPTAPAEPAATTDPATTDPAAAAEAVTLRRQLSAMQRQLSLAQSEARGQLRMAFVAELSALTSANVLTPGESKAILREADSAKTYALSTLAPYRRLAANAVPTARRAGQNATATPEPIGADRGNAGERGKAFFGLGQAKK